MLRYIRRKVVFCIILIALFLSLKKHIPDLGQTIGKWISGTADGQVSSVFSRVIDSFADSTSKAVEVFFDGIRDFKED